MIKAYYKRRPTQSQYDSMFYKISRVLNNSLPKLRVRREDIELHPLSSQ